MRWLIYYPVSMFSAIGQCIVRTRYKARFDIVQVDKQDLDKSPLHPRGQP